MESAQPLISLRIRQRPRRVLQFGLLSLLLVVTVLGCILGKWFYYRQLTVVVDARLAIVDAGAATATLSNHQLHPVKGSQYGWITLRVDELPFLLKLAGKLVEPLGTTANHTVPHWPSTAFTGVYAHIWSIYPNRMEFDQGSIGGFFGSRIAGTERQFRVECDVSLHHPLFTAVALGLPNKYIDLKDKLFSEGPLPEDHLVFLAPLGNDEYSVIIFDVKQ